MIHTDPTHTPLLQPPHQCTLLIIDDDTTLSGLLCSALKDKDFDIVTAASAAAGLQASALIQPALILLDLCLPDMDGLTVLEHIRQQNFATNIVLTSCLPVNQWGTQALAASANALLEKPYNLFAIHTVLGLLMRATPPVDH